MARTGRMMKQRYGSCWIAGLRRPVNKDLAGIMSIYEPGVELVDYDIVPPLQTRDMRRTRRITRNFSVSFKTGLRLNIAGDNVGSSRGLERMSRTLKSGGKFDTWVRFTECYRKHDGHRLAIHDHISIPVGLATGKANLNLKP
jgi:hypothetical protein